MTRKLNVFKRNLVIHQQQRNNAKYIRAAESFSFPSKSFNSEDPYKTLMLPPNDLIQWYTSVIQAWAVEFIAGYSSYTTDQIVYMTDKFIQDRYHSLQVSDALLIDNRSTYWKPSVKYCEDQHRFEIRLGETLIATFT